MKSPTWLPNVNYTSDTNSLEIKSGVVQKCCWLFQTFIRRMLSCSTKMIRVKKSKPLEKITIAPLLLHIDWELTKKPETIMIVCVTSNPTIYLLLFVNWQKKSEVKGADHFQFRYFYILVYLLS